MNRTLKERRERKYRLRGRTHRFIPPKDSDFARMSRWFANHVADHAARLGVPPEKVEELACAVAAFRDALARSLNRNTAGPKATFEKNDARKHAEKLVRATARLVRGVAEEKLTGFDRMMLNLRERPKRAKRLECPQVAPVLRFVGAVGPYGPVHSGNSLRHILEYRNDFDNFSSARPHGAARLELFVELVPPHTDEPIPSHPGERSGGRLWYLRSFTTSRFEVEFPMPPVPMMIVYWGRWADSKGNVGPWSKTVAARVEGWVSAAHEVEVSTGAVAALPDGLHGGKRELVNDARFFLAERREVCERYMEGAGTGAAALPESAIVNDARLLDAG